tara:strand:- start:312 stop:560 length:249 start_codon:yes stop_codon:yes gene_type:complete
MMPFFNEKRCYPIYARYANNRKSLGVYDPNIFAVILKNNPLKSYQLFGRIIISVYIGEFCLGKGNRPLQPACRLDLVIQFMV